MSTVTDAAPVGAVHVVDDAKVWVVELPALPEKPAYSNVSVLLSEPVSLNVPSELPVTSPQRVTCVTLPVVVEYV
jgi:hypothetical protein